MRQGAWSMVSIMGAVGALLFTSGCAAIEAGHEGVLVEQPWFFGYGGVDAVPSRTGRVWAAMSTKVIEVDIRPLQYSEHFDIISAENAPVSFDAFMIANIIESRSPELISRYGPNWYQNNVKEAFRTFVREEDPKVSALPVDDRSDDQDEVAGCHRARGSEQAHR